jgi:Alginate export
MKLRPTLLRVALWAAFAATVGLAAPVSAQSSTPPPAAPVTFTLDGSAQLTHEKNSFWGLGQQFAPTAGYARSHTWLEAFVKPGLKAQTSLGGSLTGYGGASLLATGTLGEDVFETKDTGRLLVEDAYLGLRGQAGGWNWDVSAGAQPYKLGHGFLLSAGGGNGFERGGAILAPRRAWGMTGIGRISSGPFMAEAFHLNPNELEFGDTGTRLWGLHGQWSPSEDGSVGLAHIRVSASAAPYPQAPVTIIENGREGLQTTDLIWRYEPRSGALAGLSLIGEAAWQRNSRIDMKASGWGFELGYRLAQMPFMPRLSWSMRRFSGDDPGTADKLERFDPLFYDGGPQTWSSGGNGSFAFYNSNLVVQRLRLDLVLSPRDFVNLNYWYVRAAQVDSPVQYGQAGRVRVTDGGALLVSGFPKAALSREFYVEHTRALSANAFLTWGVAGAFPQEGVKAVVTTGAKDWWAALVNLSLRY